MQKQLVFQRYELKFLLSENQKERLMTYFPCYMRPDPYGLTTIRNLYYDSDHYRLIRRSIEKPVYKEKLRLRGYGNILQEVRCLSNSRKSIKRSSINADSVCRKGRRPPGWLGSVYHRIDRRLPVRSNMCCITMNHYIRSSS